MQNVPIEVSNRKNIDKSIILIACADVQIPGINNFVPDDKFGISLIKLIDYI